ncbi:hypothetical protein BJ684DRAFT_15352 [Piptocephalis cylindrospora]|uniref:Uncharacterized protein n=1 Tax=Piptocephalis cylindrospora TaxID=1907219 RepID=A0A4P9Y5L3_9FUNG|nr:hypothetical protein BJ684DRAFT_15352 [Piptocephalis cylindrospora]|eukprot:RKP14306.1 hypothetical protein BJ684DRAFT_15352 [Piptocephalis cylindrospora]
MQLASFLATTLLPLLATTVVSLPIPGRHDRVSEVRAHIHASSSTITTPVDDVMYHFQVAGIRQEGDGFSSGPISILATTPSGEVITNPPEQPKAQVVPSLTPDQDPTFRVVFGGEGDKTQPEAFHTTEIIENAGETQKGLLSATYGRRRSIPEGDKPHPKKVHYELVVSNIHTDGNVLTSTPDYTLTVKDDEGNVLPEAPEAAIIRLSIGGRFGGPRVSMRFDDSDPTRLYEASSMSMDHEELEGQGIIKAKTSRALRSARQDAVSAAAAGVA